VSPDVALTTRALIADAANRLTKAGVSSPVVDAELLLAHVLECGRGGLILTRSVTEDQVREYNHLVEQRCRRRPLQHITGLAPFRRLEVAVGPGVFVPRPETEILAELVIRDLKRRQQEGASRLTVFDLCAGSGAMTLSIATEVSNIDMTAVELSDEAVMWLQRNVAAHADAVAKAGSVVTVIHADVTSAKLPLHADVIVSNPPYIPDGAVPQEKEVAYYDPPMALYGGRDGMDIVRVIAARAAQCLGAGGFLAFEHADVQGDTAEYGVAAVLRSTPDIWERITTLRDLAGRPRVTSAHRTGVVSPRALDAVNITPATGEADKVPGQIDGQGFGQ